MNPEDSPDVWGAKAQDWASLQEPAWIPVYRAVFAALAVRHGTTLLDVGCGGGGALGVARDLGADIYGVDGSSGLIEVARERLPGARLHVGDMSALPFEEATFDVVSGFNSFQFADDIVAALREARRVCKPSGQVAMLVWDHRERCDLLRSILPAVAALLPPSDSDEGPDFAEPGVIDTAMLQADLEPQISQELGCAFNYPDATCAWRAIASSPPLMRATRQAGVDEVKSAFNRALSPFVRGDGSVSLNNSFRWVSATRSA